MRISKEKTGIADIPAAHLLGENKSAFERIESIEFLLPIINDGLIIKGIPFLDVESKLWDGNFRRHLDVLERLAREPFLAGYGGIVWNFSLGVLLELKLGCAEANA